MGNPAWGHGYHQGLEDGFADGFKKGGAVATIVVSLVVAGVIFGYRELKARSFAKREQELSAEDPNSVAMEDAGDEHEASEGIASE